MFAQPGQNCSAACSDKELACYWPKNMAPTSLRAEFENNKLQCKHFDSKWRKNWHPAYFTNESKCVGFEGAEESTCFNSEDFGYNIRRLCHCIYKGDVIIFCLLS